MQNQTYIVTFSSANYCGAPDHCVVRAPDEGIARELAETYCEDFYYDQDSEQYEEEHGESADIYSNIDSVELLDEENEHWPYYLNSEQRANFYPLVAEYKK